ncbi:hypothetical protein PFISCL1PPCAC_981, partial [Pristionchus fissidentatus]
SENRVYDTSTFCRFTVPIMKRLKSYRIDDIISPQATNTIKNVCVKSVDHNIRRGSKRPEFGQTGPHFKYVNKTIDKGSPYLGPHQMVRTMQNCSLSCKTIQSTVEEGESLSGRGSSRDSGDRVESIKRLAHSPATESSNRAKNNAAVKKCRMKKAFEELELHKRIYYLEQVAALLGSELPSPELFGLPSTFGTSQYAPNETMAMKMGLAYSDRCTVIK